MMRGKLIMLAVVLMVAFVLTERMFEVTKTHETAPAGFDVSPTASPTEVQSAKGGLMQTDDGLAPQPMKQQGSEAERTSAIQTHDRTREHAGNKTTKLAETLVESRSAWSPAAEEPGYVDDSVVGQPFPVSESILADCDEYPRQGACEPNKALLSKMAEEPREEPWASSAERAIRALVELEPGTERPRAVTYTIRALECRRTICFVETASIIEGFHTQFFHFYRNNKLKPGYSIFSIETKQDGTKVYVTLLPVVRTAFSTKELTEQGRRQ